MMKYLDAVESSILGDDLAQIRRMLTYTSKSVNHHSKAYANIRHEVEDMNKDAFVALAKMSQHDEDVQRLLQESEQSKRKLETKVAIPEMNEEDEDMAGYGQGISTANEPKLDVSLQRQKEDIVGKLVGMNDNIRAFAGQVEDRLNNAYKAGNYSKKFGFQGISTRNMDDDEETKSVISARSGGKMSTFEKVLNKDNNRLNRMQKQAQNYLEKETGAYTGDVSKMSSSSRLSSASLPDLTGKGRIGGALVPLSGVGSNR